MNTAPIGALWPSWWPTPQPPAPPASTPVQPFEEDEACAAARDATLRPRDRDSHTPQGWRRGRRVTLEDVPTLPVPGINPWARSNPQVEW